MTSPSDNVVFIHIEKAGGTTLNDFFLENLPGFWIMPPQQHEYGWRYGGQYLQRLRRILRFQSIGGHQLGPFCDYEEVLERPFYVTFVRDPVTRFLSHVNWRDDGRTDLQAVLSNERTLNQQCFRLSGERDFEPAREIIESHPFFVGLTEKYAESLFVLQRVLGIRNAPFQSSNVTHASRKKFETRALSNDLLGEIRDRNSEDEKLYQWVVSEVFDRQKIEVGWDHDEFQRFQAEAGQFRRSQVFHVRKKLKAALCRLAIHVTHS